MATKHPSMLVSRQRGIERHGATNGAIALAMQGISEAVSINCTQLVLNQIPLWLLDDRLAGSARIGRVLIGVNHLGKPRPYAAIGHTVEARKTNERSPEALSRLAGICQICTGTHRLRHHRDANRQLTRFLTASHFVGKAVVVIKRHLLDGGNAALVKHAHVVRIPGTHLGQREEIAHHAPDLLGIARLGCKAVSHTGGSIENAGLRTRCKADDRDIAKTIVKHSCRICVLGIRCQRFG